MAPVAWSVSIMGRLGWMKDPERFTGSLHVVAGHADHVHSVAEGATPPPGTEEISSSWQRSANKHGVDPDDNKAPRILTPGELKNFRGPLEELIFTAQEELDQLYRVVREAGYTVLLCDGSGVAVEHRGEQAQASRFEYWGTWLGGVWSEEVEGTNGIGTCIVEERPVTVHRSQHYRSRHMDLSCSGAPVFGVDGTLMAVLDVSAIDPGLSEAAHALTGALTIRSARAIEERFFRDQFRRAWIVAVAPPDGGAQGMLMAIDANQRIVGANRVARRSLLLDDRALLAGISLWALFEQDLDLFRRKDPSDIWTQLLLAGSNDGWPVLVTPPDHTRSASSTPTNINLHTRPRLESIGNLLKLAPAPRAQGGLSAGAMRRVREYVEVHLSESIDLTMLAAAAGLSMHHFARQFKQSAGVTPHRYLTQKRVERAQEMLAQTDLSLSAIAYAAGFSDQSHLARHFRHILGTTPREFRWSQR
ncbi:MAG TPA: helix-turn-helix domain-containing protein [Reyranella sp.]|jgi:transcriptional regulator of acetoin/glycerol metabolism|nr:helix-turn-helix domain-containing protein [Reyranella sp.]